MKLSFAALVLGGTLQSASAFNGSYLDNLSRNKAALQSGSKGEGEPSYIDGLPESSNNPSVPGVASYADNLSKATASSTASSSEENGETIKSVVAEDKPVDGIKSNDSFSSVKLEAKSVDDGSVESEPKKETKSESPAASTSKSFGSSGMSSYLETISSLSSPETAKTSEESKVTVKTQEIKDPFLAKTSEEAKVTVKTQELEDPFSLKVETKTEVKKPQTKELDEVVVDKKIQDAMNRVRSTLKVLEDTDDKKKTKGTTTPETFSTKSSQKSDDDALFFMDDDDEELVLGSGKTLTERMLSKVPVENQAGGAGGASTLEGFKRAEENWAKVKAFKPFVYDPKLLRWTQDGNPPPKQFVSTDGAFGNPQCWAKLRDSIEKELDYDVAVCGGTLGIFFATYLQLKGHNVCVIEGGKLRGREQEWNISMDELLELMELGILSQEDIDAVVTTEFPACRSGFKNKEVTPLKGGYFDNDVGYECFTPGVLNLGVSPALLLERVSKRFIEYGGVIKEQTRLQGVCVSELVGSAIDLGEDKEPITARLVLDCMGNASPISAQQRYGMKPDGVCAVVGSCASGYDKSTNKLGDIIYTNTPIVSKPGKGSNQYFWEAFPVGIGKAGQESSDVKTTYMFTYMDADERRPSLLDLMEDYWKLLPGYQTSIKNPETDLDLKRILFAYFPTYRDSPLKPDFSRVLAVGDASGVQSPLSFGGFGALTRHLDRVGGAIGEALENDCLHKDDLGEINAYQPNLSAAWMFQKAMSVRMDEKVNATFVNRLLATNFQVMETMGERTIKPFLQDVVRFDGLVGSLAGSFAADPYFMPEIIGKVGVPELVNWLGHLGNMGMYTVLDATAGSLMKPVVNMMQDPHAKFQWRRRMEAWKFGSGADYKMPGEDMED